MNQRIKQTQTGTQTQWSFYFIVIGILLSLGVFVFVILTKEESSEQSASTAPVSVIPVNTGIQSQNSSTSQSGIETDTGKRLQTFANSGTTWGFSPFGSGKPLEEAKELKSKLEFKKPNTEWKTRTLSGITYVFGEGNPKDAKPLSEKEKEIYRKCTLEHMTQPNCGKIGSEVYGYVTPDAEKQLLKLIQNPAWEQILTHCSSDFSHDQITDPDAPTYDHILQDGFPDIDRLLIIDPETGRKSILAIPALADWLSTNVIQDFQVDQQGRELAILKPCITQNGGMEIYRDLDYLAQRLFRPEGLPYSDRLPEDRTNYIPLSLGSKL